MTKNILTAPIYYLSEDNFPIKVEPFEEKRHKGKFRDKEYPYKNDVVVTRYWKTPERWGIYGRYNSETTKEEFDLWVEYWKMYWEIESAKEINDKMLLEKKEREIKKVSKKIADLRSAENLRFKRENQ